MRWAEHEALMGQIEESMQNFGENMKEGECLEDLYIDGRNNILVGVKEIVCAVMNWVHLAQHTDLLFHKKILHFVWRCSVYSVCVMCAGSHDIHCMRDMRDALGALGPVDGQNPELNNLTCSMTEVESGDIVFITSDGVSDNFDPVVSSLGYRRRENYR
jgi:hypothetical protein